VIIARFAWIFPATYVPRALIPSLRARDPYPPLSVPFIMSWAGLRGVVSLAAALSLPEGFPGRDFILAVTFAVILVTVLVQGTTLAPLARMLSSTGFTSSNSSKLSEAEARARVAAAQLAAVEKESLNPDGSHRHPRLIEQYSYRVRASSRFSEETEALTPHRVAHFTAVLAAISAGRRELLRMHRANEIHDTVLHEIEQQLDLEECAAFRVIAADTARTDKWLQIFKIQYRHSASRDTDWQIARLPRLVPERYAGGHHGASTKRGALECSGVLCRLARLGPGQQRIESGT
jgi:CPA1 family monovalent cation:H+ antiporter